MSLNINEYFATLNFPTDNNSPLGLEEKSKEKEILTDNHSPKRKAKELNLHTTKKGELLRIAKIGSLFDCDRVADSLFTYSDQNAIQLNCGANLGTVTIKGLNSEYILIQITNRANLNDITLKCNRTKFKSTLYKFRKYWNQAGGFVLKMAY